MFKPTATTTENKSLFNWGGFPLIPDDFGFAGSFSGVPGNALIVAGGANFPDGEMPFTGPEPRVITASPNHNPLKENER